MQLAVAQAQQDLVLAMGTWKDTSPPLAVDRPHVGAYRTEYETVFGNRAPPARVRLIHRTLPVLRQAINAHCDAVIAAVDALEASGEHFETSGQGLDTILAVLDLLKRERRSFMNDVRDYNQDIAEYALNVAQPGANAKTLVSMLILPSEKGSKAKAAGATVPVGEPPAREPAAREMPADEPPAQEPQVQEAPNEEVPLEQQPAEEAPAQGGAPRELNPPPADEPLPEDNPLNQADQQGLDEQTSNYQHERPAGGHASPLGALLDVVDRPQRVQKLANLLHWDRNLPPETDGAAPLNECLRGTAGSGRLAVLAAYWRARERAARYEALNEHVEQLNLLPAIAVDIRNEPGMVEANVRLQAARQAAKAAVHDAPRGAAGRPVRVDDRRRRAARRAVAVAHHRAAVGTLPGGWRQQSGPGRSAGPALEPDDSPAAQRAGRAGRRGAGGRRVPGGADERGAGARSEGRRGRRDDGARRGHQGGLAANRRDARLSGRPDGL